MLASDLSLAELTALTKAELWHRGDLSHLLLHGGQELAYETIHAWQIEHPGDSGPCCLHCHRGLGKTALLSLLGLEECITGPRHLVRLGGPTMKEIRKAAEPSLRMFLGQRPKDIEVDTIPDGYRIYNPARMRPGEFSELTLFGCRELGNNERGIRATWIGLDEVRNIEEASFVISSVLRPMFARMSRRFMMLSSTSPDRDSHPFWEFADESARKDGYIFIPFTANEDFKHRSKEELESIFGPEGSVSWNREGLCQKAADPTILALPSFQRNKAKIVRTYTRPEYYHPYVSMDMGFVDCAAALFAFIDYERQRLVVEREIVGPSINTEDLIHQIRSMETVLWQHCPHLQRLRRWADATPREIDDLRHAGLYFSPAKKGEEKWDKWAGLARLDSALAYNRVEIHPSCKSLIYQLEHAVKNKWHDDLEREVPRRDASPSSPIMGHQDALWALAYLVGQVRSAWLQSPLPAEEPGVGRYHGVEIERVRVDEERKTRTTEISNRPLVITENTGHIQGINLEKKTIGGRRVRFK